MNLAKSMVVKEDFTNSSSMTIKNEDSVLYMILN